MRRKLILEISQDESQIKQAKAELKTKPKVMKIAATPQGAADPAAQLLRPGTNEFSNNCDIAGGFGFGGFNRF